MFAPWILCEHYTFVAVKVKSSGDAELRLGVVIVPLFQLLLGVGFREALPSDRRGSDPAEFL